MHMRKFVFWLSGLLCVTASVAHQGQEPTGMLPPAGMAPGSVLPVPSQLAQVPDGGTGQMMPGQNISPDPAGLGDPNSAGPMDPAMMQSADAMGGLLPDPAAVPTPPIPESWLRSWWNPQPRFEVRAEAVFLKANFEPTVPLVRQNQIDRTGSFYTNRLINVRGDEQFIAAPRLTLEYHINHYKSIEASGFVLDGPDQYLTPAAATDAPVFLDVANTNPLQQGALTNLPPGFPTAADDFRVNWRFRTQSGELNYLRHYIFENGPISDFAIGVGARYFGFTETAQLKFLDIVNTREGRFNSNVDNQLAGIQFMSRGRWQTPLPWMRFAADGKVGLMANTTEAKQSVFASQTGYNLGTRYTTTVFSPLVEGNFYFEFFLAKNISAFGGIQLLYVDRVRRGSGQFEMDVDRFLYDPKRLGSAFLWGPRVGLTIAF